MKVQSIILAAALMACSKEKLRPASISITTETKSYCFNDYKVSVVPYCGNDRIYSITSGDKLLISIVTDTLRAQRYRAGINMWGDWTDDITIDIKSVRADDIHATFDGKISHGYIN